MTNDSLGDRMKNLENIYRGHIIPKIPAIIRVDGRAFHSLTKKYCSRPFDEDFSNAMIETGKTLMKEIQCSKIVYIQSDEISILLDDRDTITTQQWFTGNIQKMVSISACIAAQTFVKTFFMKRHEFFNQEEQEYKFISSEELPLVCFDSRVFNIPEDDVMNYFIWRQQDWIRNSVQMYCGASFSHKEMHKKNTSDMQDMLHSVDKNWATDLAGKWKNGTFLFKDGTIYDEKISYHPSYQTFLESLKC